MVFPKSTKIVEFCRLTPKKETVECAKETVYTLEPVEKVRKVTVCAKKLVKEPEEITVYKQIAKTVTMCEVCAEKHDAQDKDEARTPPPPAYPEDSRRTPV